MIGTPVSLSLVPLSRNGSINYTTDNDSVRRRVLFENILRQRLTAVSDLWFPDFSRELNPHPETDSVSGKATRRLNSGPRQDASGNGAIFRPQIRHDNKDINQLRLIKRARSMINGAADWRRFALRAELSPERSDSRILNNPETAFARSIVQTARHVIREIKEAEENWRRKRDRENKGGKWRSERKRKGFTLL